jgi:uncharacterized membrane protein
MVWEEREVGLVLLAVAIVSFVWMVMTGISAGNLIPLAVFSVSFSAMLVLFGDWFSNEE